MKLKLFLFLSVFISSFYLTAYGYDQCYLQQQYESMGWFVHPSSEFAKREIYINHRLQQGLEDKTIVVDISGPVVTRNTVSGQEVELIGYMFDDLNTSADEMFGDLAVVEDEQNNRVELRWYENKVRHIVFNANILTCITEPAPVADNSVF